MEPRKSLGCFCLVMLLAAAEGLQSILKVVGQNLILPDAVPEEGFLLRESKNVAVVFEKKLRIYEETSRILWDETSGLFTITDLQKNDSGVYVIDSKKRNVFTASYNLTVFDPAAPPAVRSLNSSSDSCLLLCSVDRLSSLSWFRGPEELERGDSVLSLRVSISREELNSSFRCESSSPADKASVTVDVKTLCPPIIPEECSRLKWAAIAVAIATSAVLIVLVVYLIWRCKVDRNSRNPARQDLSSGDSVQYTEIQFRDMQGTSSEEDPQLSTGYDLLQIPRMYETEPSDLTTVYTQIPKHT